MSRTIRRKKEPLPYHFRMEYHLGIGRIPREGKDLERKILEFHADWGVGYHKWGISTWFRNQEQARFKMGIKQELAKFWKDPEYEVQIRDKYKHDWD